MSADGGYTLQYRRMWDNPVFRNYKEAAVFFWMKDAAQWRDNTIRTNFGPVKLRTGELLIAERELAERFDMHRNTLRNLIHRMSDEGMIELLRDRCPHRAGTVVLIRNYQYFQSLNPASGPKEDQSGTESEAEGGPKEDRSGTKNNTGNTGEATPPFANAQGGVAGQAPSVFEEGRSPDGEPTDRDLLGEATAHKPRRKRGDGADRGTRIPDGELPEAWTSAANHTREKHELPRLNRRVLGLRWESFRNYWSDVPGSKGLKLDWKATWLNDCINPVTEKKFPAESATSGKAQKPLPQLRDILASSDKF